MLSNEVQISAARSILCWLATVNEDGQPNVSPKEIFAAFDTEHLVIANIASPTSVRNIEVNPLVCVSFIDVFVQKGFKVTGAARNVRRKDTDFSHWAAPLEAKGLGSPFTACSLSVLQRSNPSWRQAICSTQQKRQNSHR